MYLSAILQLMDSVQFISCKFCPPEVNKLEVASSITSGMAGGSIVSGMYKEPYDVKDIHSRIGIIISLVGALLLIFFIGDPFKGLIYSQVFLSVQLPFTVALQIYLTSSKKVMGKYANSTFLICLLLLIAGIVTFLNIKLLLDFLGGL